MQPIEPPGETGMAYRQIVRHYETCLERYGDSCAGVDWPNAEDARTRYEVMLGVVRPPVSGRSGLLDFGCGASHLYEYLLATGRVAAFDYQGLDLSPRFIELSKRKFPQICYHCLDVLAEPVAVPPADYVVANGVFTEKCSLSFEGMLAYFSAMLPRLFALARTGLAFNVMSSQVDWERSDLFHVPFDTMARLLVTYTSRKFVFRQDYGLHEYTVYVYR